MAVCALQAKLTGVDFGFFVARNATGAGANIMLVAVTLGAVAIGVPARQSELVMIKALDHAVLPVVAFRAGGAVFLNVCCHCIVIVTGMAGDAICFLGKTAVLVAMAGVACHLLAVIVGDVAGKAKFGQHKMIYIVKSQFCQIGFLAVVFRVASLTARNARKPTVQGVNILALGGNVLVTILAGAVTETVDGDVAMRAIV